MHTRTTLATILAAAFTTPAFACYPNCPAPVHPDNQLTSIINTHNLQHQKQEQEQEQQQKQTATGGNATASANGGQGGAATVANTDARTYIDQSHSMTSVQPARLPDTITLGNLTLQAKGDCGRRHKIEPFSRVRHTPKLLGLWSTQEDVQTAHGLDMGPDAVPFQTETIEIPATNERITTVYGHRIYVTVGNDGSNGASSLAANHDNGNFYGLGTSNAAGMNYGVVGFVALECEFRKVVGAIIEPPAKPAPAKVAKAPKPGTGPCKMPGRVRHADGLCYRDPCEVCLKAFAQEKTNK